MENILLVINIILAILLVLFVLFQKSEGGALGIGVSQDSFMFSRSAGDFFTKATGFVAALFIICSIVLVRDVLAQGYNHRRLDHNYFLSAKFFYTSSCNT